MISHPIILLAVLLGSIQGSIGGLVIIKHIEPSGGLKVMVIAEALVAGIILGFIEVGMFLRFNRKEK